MARTPDDPRLDLLQGTLDMLILRTLQWGPQHGHGIGQAIRAQSDDLRVETGSLYPALHRLEARLAQVGVGAQRSQPAREILPPHRRRQGAALPRTGPLVPARRGDRPDHEPGARQGVAPCVPDEPTSTRRFVAISRQREGTNRPRRGSRGRPSRGAPGIRLRAGHTRFDAARLVQPLARVGRGART